MKPTRRVVFCRSDGHRFSPENVTNVPLKMDGSMVGRMNFRFGKAPYFQVEKLLASFRGRYEQCLML